MAETTVMSRLSSKSLLVYRSAARQLGGIELQTA
jgi:hypothetical protein